MSKRLYLHLDSENKLWQVTKENPQTPVQIPDDSRLLMEGGSLEIQNQEGVYTATCHIIDADKVVYTRQIKAEGWYGFEIDRKGKLPGPPKFVTESLQSVEQPEEVETEKPESDALPSGKQSAGTEEPDQEEKPTEKQPENWEISWDLPIIKATVYDQDYGTLHSQAKRIEVILHQAGFTGHGLHLIYCHDHQAMLIFGSVAQILRTDGIAVSDERNHSLTKVTGGSYALTLAKVPGMSHGLTGSVYIRPNWDPEKLVKLIEDIYPSLPDALPRS